MRGCLGETEVLSLLAGEITDPALQAAEEHLDSCKACRSLLSALSSCSGADSQRLGVLSAFEPGDVIAGRYRMHRLIGAGGMGEVYEALDEVLGERVALKTIPLAGLDAPRSSRFNTEVQAARKVTHRNVCRVFDVGQHVPGASSRAGSSPTPFFTMELLHGETLRARVRRLGACPAKEALPLIDQLAAGVDAAHQAGIAHGDFKTENVVLVNEWGGVRAVITDFGLARPMSKPLAHGRRTAQALAGTIGYMAPEQVAGAPASSRSDIYALGVVILELLFGQPPFAADALAAAVAEVRWVPPEANALKTLDPPVRAIVERCLSVAPGERFETAGDVARALRQAVFRRGVGRLRSRQVLVAASGLAVASMVAIGAYSSARSDSRAMLVTSPNPPETHFRQSALEQPAPTPGTALEKAREAQPDPALPRSSSSAGAIRTGAGDGRKQTSRVATPSRGASRPSPVSSSPTGAAAVPSALSIERVFE